MIDLVIGPPGSGKTYYVVDEIYTLITSKQKKYKNIYTNINGFNYDYANQLAGIKDYCRPLSFEQLLQQMVAEYNEHELYKQDSSKYDDYDKHIQQIGLFTEFRNSLIVIDECHLFFTVKKDDIHTRFLSYHRHFDIDMIIVTQYKNLINKAYLAFIERMIVASPKRFLSIVFRYEIYISYKEYNKNKIGNVFKKLSQKVSKLYNSGSTRISKSVLFQKLLPLFFMVIALYFGYSFFQKSLKKSTPLPPEPQHAQISKSDPVYTSDISISDSSKVLLSTRCYPDTCVFDQFDRTFTKSALLQIVTYYNCTAVVSSTNSFDIRTYVLSCDSSIQDFIQLFKGTQNEKAIVPSLIDN